MHIRVTGSKRVKVLKKHRHGVPDARVRTVKTQRADCHSFGSGDEHGPDLVKIAISFCQKTQPSIRQPASPRTIPDKPVEV